MKRHVFLFGVMVFLCVYSRAESTVWYVHPDSTLNSIQRGIDLCTAGDTVLVGPGTYIENINFNGMAITVRSEYGSDTTTIDGSSPSHPDTGSVVLFVSSEDTSTILEGFTIISGTGTIFTGYSSIGGGILCVNSSPTIVNNTITENTACDGGGIYCWNSAGVVIGNVITHNVCPTS